MKPLLSIVIPTKDRYEYLKKLMQYLTSFNTDETEIIIQDNTSDNDEMLTFIQESSCKNIKYFYTSEQLTITEQCDRAILNSTGQYVCCIGDDDCVLSNIIDVVRSMDISGVDVGVFSRPYYIWPDIDITKPNCYFQYYSIKSVSTQYSHINPIAEIEKCLKHGGGSLERMPKVYHGIAQRKVLDKIYQKFGTYFPGPSPDMANAVALSFCSNSVVYIDYPVIIAGTGKIRIKKNERHGDEQKIEDVSFLSPITAKHWNPEIPYIWTAPTIYAQTLYYTLSLLQVDNLFSSLFNWDAFYIGLGSNHYKFVRECWHNNKANKIKIYINVWMRIIAKRIIKVCVKLHCHSFVDLSLKIFRRGNLFSFNKKQLATIQDFTAALESKITKWDGNSYINNP